MLRPYYYCSRRFFATRDRHTAGGGGDGVVMGLNKWMAHQGWCSRREADAWIARGWVRVNGNTVTKMPYFVDGDGTDDVQVDRHAIQQLRQATILLHKPLGIVSSQPEHGHTPAVKLLTAERQFSRGDKRAGGRGKGNNNDDHNPFRQRGWRVAGRLDSNSTGLLILTQSGQIAQQLVSPRPGSPIVEKEYLVRVPADASTQPDWPQRLERLRQGITDDGDDHRRPPLRARSVEVLHDDSTHLRIVLTAGRKHHIRRMLAAVRVPVRAIKRVRIGRVVLGDLPLGKWRYLGPHERFV